MKTFEFVNQELGTNYKSDNEIDWGYISRYYKLSEDFIRKNKNKVNWYNVSVTQKLSEKFIKEFANRLDWDEISIYQKLSEDFIKEFADKVNWLNISQYQKLSEKFIKEFANRFDWVWISKYQKLSKSFINKNSLKLTMPLLRDNWIYKTAEEKKTALINTGKYECHDDYFIAYKAIREDRYSLFNFQYQYFPNEEYESWCDCSDSGYSFGLYVGTRKCCKNYLGKEKGKIIKCKIQYKDIGRIMDNEVRCLKIKILE